jgi:adenosyl cobinamide kinase/adenosyl cobinamide phosphate guanylyltransferase
MTSPKDAAKKELGARRNANGENRLPPAAAVIVAGLAYALLPASLLFGPRFVIPGLELVLLVALIATNPRRMTRETRWSRIASIGLASLVILTNLVALGMLVHSLTEKSSPGEPLLVAAMQVWLTNVIGFGLLFWELDRGGPVARRVKTHAQMAPADWRFSQDENHDAVSEVAATASKKSGWIPTFVDYLYVSLTNSSAFSPTDTMPLSSRAKVLMGIEATAALLTSLLVIARAVGSLEA